MAALLLPALKNAKELAVQKDCLSRQRQILIASSVYTSDNNGYLPPNCLNNNTYWGQIIINNAWSAPEEGGMGLLRRQTPQAGGRELRLLRWPRPVLHVQLAAEQLRRLVLAELLLQQRAMVADEGQVLTRHETKTFNIQRSISNVQLSWLNLRRRCRMAPAFCLARS